ncbi:imidazole glycerol phosphate synthase hisHF [Phakopsora pachyrhizi]|uniref:Imidazole glycerol phosphate synthase hisHF n=1 Tax=Phakopsora pachyrhizi TaxID=170000 RepID=A0AAV0AFE0_PHAPC|nr:imidazole glycerol phosphate synthase hisHF [Phakopsora pachyrhizi]CAH7666166.1 imidazole glycerol phosphate synthase hisHF [Phakopsora pachyrhizi]
MIYLLDYGAGNVRSLANSISQLGFEYKWVESPKDLKHATKLIFPGVGAFGPAMNALRSKGYAESLIEYIKSGKPYMGICIGMQALFLSSEESPDVPGLGIVPAHVAKFDSTRKTVPHMGWNMAVEISHSGLKQGEVRSNIHQEYYYVHSFRVKYDKPLKAWTKTVTRYKDEVFVSSLRRGNLFATQFHPEKSGPAGLLLLKQWLSESPSLFPLHSLSDATDLNPNFQDSDIVCDLRKRIIACLDVRENDQGDLVVTKGDQYDVREPSSIQETSQKTDAKGQVRNLGKPVDLARRYYQEGADEITFLNITSFRSCPLNDQPMLSVLEKAAESVFVPFCVGGGIRDSTDPDGTPRPALEVATAYFRAGADKVSIGSDAVIAVEAFMRKNNTKKSGIEEISRVYGKQAVVVSIDPRRVYVAKVEDAPLQHQSSVVDLSSRFFVRDSGRVELEPDLGPNGERFCWYQCTINGGRESRPVDVVQMAKGVEALGAGEILLNSVDKDGSKSGFDLRLVELVRRHVTIPVIASSGAGKVEDFESVFEKTNVEAALAAGIFHRNEVTISSVKSQLFLKK